MTIELDMKEDNAGLKIGWYARDGYLDFFPMIASRMDQMDSGFSSFFACNHSAEEATLKQKYGVGEPWVISHYLRDRRKEIDISDAHLLALAEQYDAIPLIQCLWAELFIKQNISEQEFKEHLVGHIRFWEDFFDRFGIDVLVSELPSIPATCIAWLVCKGRGVQFVAFRDISPLGTRTAFTTSFDGHFEGLRDALEMIGARENAVYMELADSFLNEISQSGVKKALTAVLERELVKEKGILLANIPFSISRFNAYMQRVRSESEYYIHRNPFERVMHRVKLFLNAHLVPRIGFFEKLPSLKNDQYFLFPLHQPEEWSNFSGFGLKIADPVATIREIAHCLPPWSRLYVKEHTASFGARNIKVYVDIKKIRNVSLISPFSNTQELIKHCQAVVTYGSTMGFEALLVGKPVILLSKAWYHLFPGVYMAETPEQLAVLLQRAHRLEVPARDQLQRCVAALYAISFDGCMYPPNVLLSSENVSQFAKALVRKLKEKGHGSFATTLKSYDSR